MLLDEVSLSEDDKVVFLGDYVDKGPDVSGTLDLLIGLGHSPNFTFLRGNHDQLFLNALRKPSEVAMWECLAGESPLSSYGVGASEELLGNVPRQHLEFLESRCCDSHETEEFIFVHGGIQPHQNPAEEDRDRLQWSALSLAAPHISGRTVVCGHTSQSTGTIADLGHTICIDTGITKGQWLTCLDLTDFSFTQVSAKLECRRGVLRPISDQGRANKTQHHKSDRAGGSEA